MPPGTWTSGATEASARPLALPTTATSALVLLHLCALRAVTTDVLPLVSVDPSTPPIAGAESGAAPVSQSSVVIAAWQSDDRCQLLSLRIEQLLGAAPGSTTGRARHTAVCRLRSIGALTLARTTQGEGNAQRAHIMWRCEDENKLMDAHLACPHPSLFGDRRTEGAIRHASTCMTAATLIADGRPASLDAVQHALEAAAEAYLSLWTTVGYHACTRADLVAPQAASPSLLDMLSSTATAVVSPCCKRRRGRVPGVSDAVGDDADHAPVFDEAARVAHLQALVSHPVHGTVLSNSVEAEPGMLASNERAGAAGSEQRQADDVVAAAST
ncbi:MAG: hypothetical protein EOO41_05660, partial [Methanobacteriota archaeon]